MVGAFTGAVISTTGFGSSLGIAVLSRGVGSFFSITSGGEIAIGFSTAIVFTGSSVATGCCAIFA